eukprot:350839-Chlamydomonas_euryale.AAC.3
MLFHHKISPSPPGHTSKTTTAAAATHSTSAAVTELPNPPPLLTLRPTPHPTPVLQDDSSSRQAKHLDVALVHDRLVIIMDDTEQVWPHHQSNLIKVWT